MVLCLYMFLQIDIQYIYYIYTILNIFAFPIQAPVQTPILEDAQAKLSHRTCVNTVYVGR